MYLRESVGKEDQMSVQEKHQANKKKLYHAFVDLEKVFDRVPREVV